MRERFTLSGIYLCLKSGSVNKRLPISILLLFFISFSFAQVNDDCNSATSVPIDGSCQNYDNTGATFDIGNGTCVSGTNNVWFSFVAQGTNYDIDVSSPDPAFKPETTLLFFDPTPCDFGSANQIDCGESVDGGGLIIGQTYYVIVTSGIDAEGTFELCVDNPVAAPPPSNDDPCTPTAVTANGSCTAGTTISATPELENPACTGNSENSVWYTTTIGAGNNSLNVNLQNTSLSGTIAINVITFTPDCNGSATIVAGGGYCGTAAGANFDVSGLTPGTTYYIQVGSTTAGEGDFDICLTESGPPAGCADNDLCNDAEDVSVATANQTCVDGCNTGASPGPIFNPPGGCFDFPNETVWYSFTPQPGTGLIQVDVTSGDLNQPQVAVFTGDCNIYTQIACNTGNGGSVTLNNVAVTVGTEYLIAISDGASADGEFELCLEAFAQGSNCNTDSDVTVVSTSLGSPVSGPFQPGELVEICLNINDFNSGTATNGCQWLHGIVPEFGDCWEPSSFLASGQPAIITTPLTAAANASVWSWFPNGIVLYNDINPGYLPANTPVGGGWFTTTVPGNNPACTDFSNPNCTFGDGAGCNDNNNFSWTVCFQLTARQYPECEQSPTYTDCTVSFRSFGDGETGGWTSQGCEADLPWFNNLSLNCCAGPVMTPVPPQTICSGGQTSIILSSDQDPNVSYTWTVLPTGVQGAGDCLSGCSNTITQILTNNSPVSQVVTYVVTPTSNDGCTGIPININVTVLPEVSITIPPLPPVCAGSCVTISPIVTGGAPPYFYTWDNGAVGNNPEVCPTLTTTYSLTVTDANQCSSTEQITIQANSNLQVELTADPGTQICNNDPDFPITLNASVTAGGSGNYVYNWAPVAGAGNVLPVFETNTYCVTVTDLATQCEGTDCIDIVVDFAPFVSVVDPGPLGGCLNSLQLQGVPSGGVWSGVADFSGFVYPSILGEGMHEVTYTYTDQITGCTESYTFDITVTGAPDVDSLGNFNACNEFILPPITGTDLTGNQAYYAGTGGTGTVYNPGDAINTNTTLYLYDDDGNCSDEEVMVITIVPLPEINDIPNVTSCNFYILETITGTNLTGNEAYFDGVDGTGTMYNPGDTIFSTTGMYIYDDDGMGCSDQEQFLITISTQPDIDPIDNVEACNFYTLPAITGTNLSGSQSYYTGTGGTGTSYAAGDMINSTTTLYIYDGSAGCFDEESFSITIFIQPDIDAVNNVSACNTYNLPAITGNNLSGNESYFSGPNGTGTTFAVGDAISTNTTVYIFDNAGIAGCEDEESFMITIIPQPELDAVANVSTCDQYELPAITGSNLSGTEGYFSQPGGNGTSFAPGDIINTNSTIYIYDNAGLAGCEDETSFMISITSAPELDPISNVSVCNEYTLPTINGNNLPGTEAYYTGAGGTGTSYNAGDVISTSTTLFVYANAGLVNCEDETSFEITIVAPPELDNMDNVSSCDEYELPAITGTNLSGSEGYYSQPGGNGTSYSSGDIISSNTTIYVYDDSGVAGCTDEVSFTITITNAPELDAIDNVSICNEYTLPTINGNNLPGTEAYFTGAGGTGTSYNPGDVISASTTLFVYVNAGLTNCEDEISFSIDITPQPLVDDIQNIEACNSYTLENISGSNLTGNEAYYTGTNGSGTSYAPGDVINSSITLYIYDDAGIANCSSEESFTISITQQPDIIAPANVEACDSYVLQAITGSNLSGNVAYYSGPGGTGTSYQAGDVINASATLYIYDESGGPACSDEEQFEITINPTPTSDFTVTGPICTSDFSTITFTGNAGANATFNWNFAGGTILSGSGEGPYEIQWAGAGTYSVTLQVDENNCSSTQSSQNVTVEAPLSLPVINCNPTTTSIEFTWNDVIGATGYNVTVITGPTGTMTGATSYEVTGLTPNTTVEIMVEAIGTGPCGNSSATFSCDAIDCPGITININPVDDICLDGNNASIQLVAMVTGSDGSGIGTWSGPGIVDATLGTFDPTDASVSLGANSITYTFLEATCSYVESLNINVFQQPTATFTVESPLCLGDDATVSYTGNASTNATFNWDFDGATIISGSGQGPFEINWNTGTSFDVTLTVEENGCISNLETVTVSLDQPLATPVINCITGTDEIEFTWNDVTGASGYDVILVNGTAGIQNGNSYLITGLNPNDSVTITVIALSNNSCENSSSTSTCFANNCPPISLDLTNPANDICLDNSQSPVNLAAAAGGSDGSGNGNWSGPGITDPVIGIFNPDDPSVNIGNNTVTYTFTEQGCTYTETLDINILAPPSSAFMVQSPICTDQTCTVNYQGDASSNASYEWNFAGGSIISGSGEGPYELSFSAGGTYDVSLLITDENGCVSEQIFQSVEVSEPLATPVINCNTTTSSIEFIWENIPGATDYQVNVISGNTGIQNGTSYLIDNLNPDDVVEIEVIALGPAPCGNNSNSQTCQATACTPVIMFIEPVEDICLDANTTPICLEVTILGSDGSGMGVWSGPGIPADGSCLFDPSLASLGSNIITYTFVENGCVTIETTEINVFFPPNANFSVTSPICEEGISMIEANAVAGGIYTWDFAGGTIVSGSDEGPYEISWPTEGMYNVSLFITDANGCVSNMTTEVVEVIAPLEPPVINCNTNTSSIEFSWDDVTGATGFNINVLDGNTGTQSGNSYTVNGLNPNDSVTIELIVLGPQPCGNISVIQTCYATDCPNITLTLDAVSDICVTDDDLPFNLNATVNNSDGSGTGIWSGNGIINPNTGLFDPNDPSINFGPNTITYQFSESGCPFSETIDINVFETPEITSITGGEISCAISQVNLGITATGTNLDYQWSGGNITSTDDIPNPTVDLSAWYFVTVTDNITGCFTNDSILVNQGADLPQAFAGDDQMLTCQDSVVFLQASGSTGANFEFEWEGPLDASQVNEQFPEVTNPGMYILTVNDILNNCSSTPDTVLVDIDNLPPVAIITNPLDPIDCELLVLSLDGQEVPNGAYEWQDENGLILGNDPSIQVENQGTYFFTVLDTLNGCFDLDSIDVIDNTDYPIITLAAPDDLNCAIDEIQLDASGSQTGPDITIEWTGPNGGINGPSDELITTATLQGIYTLTLIDTLNGCENDTTLVVSEIDDAPTAIANNPEELDCNTTEVEVSGLNSIGMGSLSYEWYFNAANIAQSANTNVAETGTYMLVVTDDVNSCSDTTFVDVFENADALNGALLDIQNPSCYGEDDALIFVEEVFGGTPNYQYAIDSVNFTSLNVIPSLTAGEYTLTIIDQENCSWDTTLTILDPAPLELILGDDLLLTLGDDANINAQFNIPDDLVDTLIWSPMEMLVCVDSLSDFCKEVYAAPLNNLLIEATLTDTNGCSVRDEILLRVEKDPLVFIPNVFTPNNDGENDVLRIFTGQGVVKVNHFLIYDRWGELMYEGHDFDAFDPGYGWDGTLRGEMVNPAVFVYWAEVELIDGQRVLFKGDITLVR